jgi:transcriptional regulator with XRE-family HTH domain
MLDTRKRLQQLLDRENISANLLAAICKVPPPTIYRFLNGFIDEPRASTICKWAQAFGVSEAQMRGIEPIEGLEDIREVITPMTLESVLTPDELIAIEGMRRHNKNIRSAWLLIGKELCKKTARKPRVEGEDERTTIDRRRGGKRNPSTGMKYRQPGGPLAEPKEA